MARPIKYEENSKENKMKPPTVTSVTVQNLAPRKNGGYNITYNSTFDPRENK